jgi:hypothetical protein
VPSQLRSVVIPFFIMPSTASARGPLVGPSMQRRGARPMAAGFKARSNPSQSS